LRPVADLLLASVHVAEEGDRAGVEEQIALLERRHVETARELLHEHYLTAALEGIHSLLEEFRRVTGGILMLSERPPRTVDEAVAIGERLSALLISAWVESTGQRSAAVSGQEVIVTDSIHGNASPLMEQTTAQSRRVLYPLLEAGVLPFVTGFNGGTVDGKGTTLGRGGSDFSASILAAALDAAELYIWSDVDGILSADPRLVPDATILNEITYREAAELAYNGAKVLHPRTLAPLVEKGIPVWSKNSFNTAAEGTRIVPKTSAALGVRAVTSMASVAMVSVEPASASVDGALIMGRSLEALARANAEVLMFSSSSYRQSFCFLIRKDEVQQALSSLEAALALELSHGYVKPIEVDDNVALLAVVGEGMHGMAGIAGRIFTAVSRENISIIAIAQGSSELTISIVVRRDGIEKAVKAIHAECGLGSAKTTV
jgi:bifunctional aspartokinase / homoserine dehydrogenase 1